MKVAPITGGWLDACERTLGPRFPTFRVALRVLLQFGGVSSLRKVRDWRGAGWLCLLDVAQTLWLR